MDHFKSAPCSNKQSESDEEVAAALHVTLHKEAVEGHLLGVKREAEDEQNKKKVQLIKETP